VALHELAVAPLTDAACERAHPLHVAPQRNVQPPRLEEPPLLVQPPRLMEPRPSWVLPVTS
jgi:hypothetical protein